MADAKTPEGYDESTVQLARQLAAAFLSESMGIGVEYALKTKVPEMPSEYWLALAHKCRLDVLDVISARKLL